MRVFVTGSTGFIGSHLVPELIQAGHKVLGLARSEAGAEALRMQGAEPLMGNIEDLECLRAGVRQADGVIHLAFNHDFSKMEQNCANDLLGIEAMGKELEGSQRAFVVTSGTGVAANVNGQPSNELSPAATWNPRGASEYAVQKLAARGVNASIVRLAQIHDTRKQGLISYVLAVARAKGSSAYIGDGTNRWPAAHVLDTAQLYRLAFEAADAGAIYHAVAEEGIAMKTIAETLGRGLHLPVMSIAPEEAPAHFGWLARFAGHDMPSTSHLTQQKLNWKPSGPDVISDLEKMEY